jgi:hypothetical protein
VRTSPARITLVPGLASNSTVLRNPGSVVRHAALARRKARRALEAFVRDHFGEDGLRFALGYERAKFLAAEGDVAGARQCAERALRAPGDYGDSEERDAVKGLLASLDVSAAS